MPEDQEYCKVCDYCKFVDQLCLKCKKYINEERTLTIPCAICGQGRLQYEPCYHEHNLTTNIKIDPAKLISTTNPNPFCITNDQLAPYTIKPTFTNSFIFFKPGSDNKEEMIKITKDGFWVRGVKIEQGPLEAKEVYKAFLKLLGFSSDHLREETQDSEASGSETN